MEAVDRINDIVMILENTLEVLGPVRDELVLMYNELLALRIHNRTLEERLAKYDPFNMIIGDPTEEFAKLRRDMHRLQRENIKLRDLVGALLVCDDDKADARIECPVYDAKSKNRCRIDELMRELGIER